MTPKHIIYSNRKIVKMVRSFLILNASYIELIRWRENECAESSKA